MEPQEQLALQVQEGVVQLRSQQHLLVVQIQLPDYPKGHQDGKQL